GPPQGRAPVSPSPPETPPPPSGAGRARGPAGKPVGAAAVQALLDEDTRTQDARSFGVGVYTGFDGRFELPVDGEGIALVAIGAPGFRPSVTRVELARDRTVDLGDIRLDRGATLAGRVDHDGVSRERVAVRVTWCGGGGEDV